MAFTVYRLEVAPGESVGEGEDHDEWFGSLGEAQRRRRFHIEADPELLGHRTRQDYRITRVVLAALSPKSLLLAVLNRVGFMADDHEVQAPYRPKEAA